MTKAKAKAAPAAPDPVIGTQYGKWRVASVETDDDGKRRAKIVNTKNPAVRASVPLGDLDSLGGS